MTRWKVMVQFRDFPPDPTQDQNGETKYFDTHEEAEEELKTYQEYTRTDSESRCWIEAVKESEVSF